MEELRAIFLSQIKNIPFIECIDENQFYDEFLNSPVETINQELILSEILKGRNISEINSDDEQKFNTKLLEVIKTKNKNYYIPDITRTQTYQTITKINEVYTDFLYLISEKKKNQIVEGKSLNEIPDTKIIYDRFLDPKINAERILQILEYFNEDTQHRIIQKIINDDSAGLYSVTEKNNPNFQQTKNALENFRNYLHELDKKSNSKATQKHSENKIEKKYKYNVSAYIIAYYLDCKALGYNPKKSKKELLLVGGQYCDQHSPSTFERHFDKIVLEIDNSKDLKQKILEYLGDDWEDIILSISKNKEVLKSFLKEYFVML